MPWPVHISMNQHLEEMNENEFSRPLKVTLVRVEGPHAGPGGKHTRHVHPYWQMEVYFGGNSSVEFDHMTLYPKKGDVLIIPPQNWHYYDFGDYGKKGWSVKFNFEGLEERFPPAIIEHCFETDLLINTITETLKKEYVDSRKRFTLLEHLIASLLDLHFSQSDLQGTEIDLVKKVRAIIDEKLSDNIRVEDIAAEIGLTRTYITRVFKKQLGVPLKVFIDQQRFDTAKRLMLFSALNISEVAEELGFPDLFSFSRFFKRMSSLSPRNFLNKVKKQG